MKIYADLHTHTTASDGVISPIERFEKAENIRLKRFSVSDHDSIEAIEECVELAETNSIEFLSSISTD